MADDTKQMTKRVNRLYWETDKPVTEISSELDVSRGTLYNYLEPAAAGEACPECGTGLVYRNRSTRSSGEIECPDCGLETDIATGRGAAAATSTPSSKPSKPPVSRRPAAASGSISGADSHGRGWVGGAAIAGLAVAGVALALIGYRRS